MVRIACLLGILLLLAAAGPAEANPVPVFDPQWIATPPVAPPFQPIALVFSNTTPNLVTLPNYGSWWIENSNGDVVFTPFSCQVLVPVPPGGSLSWSWDQRDNQGNQVAAGAYQAMIRWYDSAMNLHSAGAPIRILGGVLWRVSPDPVIERTGLALHLSNLTGGDISLDNSAPWWITDPEGNTLFSPFNSPTIDTLSPGESRNWPWNLKYHNGADFTPGSYLARILYRNADRTLAAVAQDPFTIIPAPNGDPVWKVIPPINGTKSVIAMTFTNSTTGTIYLPDTSPWEIVTDQGNYVDTEGALTVVVPVPAGATVAWSWDERDWRGNFVPDGWYRARVHFSKSPPESWDPETKEARFRLLQPPVSPEPCEFVTSPSYVYPPGSDIDFTYTNCVPDSVGMMCTAFWWISTITGQPVYWPVCGWALTIFEHGEGFDFTWPGTRAYDGSAVPPGQYLACVHFTDKRFLTRYVVTSRVINITTDASGVPRSEEVPDLPQVGLAPNPLRDGFDLSFQVERPGTEVMLAVYDAQGRLVERDPLGRYAAGAYTVTWNARGDDGRRLPGGVYLCRIHLGAQVEVRRFVVVP